MGQKNRNKNRNPRCTSETHETPIRKFQFLVHKSLFCGEDTGQKLTKALRLELGHYTIQYNLVLRGFFYAFSFYADNFFLRDQTFFYAVKKGL